MSYYSLYRPQTIAALDLLTVRTSLLQVLSSGKFSHAYLFSGPKGTGKTSSARILAKVLNCEQNRKAIKAGKGTLIEPCNECDSCKRITNGSSLACMEMDAASNRGIDDIRTLRERIGLAPAEGIIAVYIIDEVHMLTTEAFNALLKTLEEPPAHAVFILCTTDPEKIPDTVISRCTRVQFQKASVAEVVESLGKVVKGEGLRVSKDVLEMIAARVDGSFRDGMKTLEQLAQSGAEIVKEMVDVVTGHGEAYDPQPLITALIAQDMNSALAELHQKLSLGLDVSLYARRLVEEVRRQLLGSLAGRDRILQETMVEMAAQIEAAAVLVRRATIPSLPLEIMVARWCLGGVAPERKQPFQPVREKPSLVIPREQEHRIAPPVSPAEKVEIERLQPLKNAYTGNLNDIATRWQEVMLAVRPLNHSLEGVLRSTRPLQFENGWLVIEAFYKFHKERLEQDGHRRLLEAAIGNLLGGSIQLKFVLGEKSRSVNDSPVENISTSVEDDALVKAAEDALLK